MPRRHLRPDTLVGRKVEFPSPTFEKETKKTLMMLSSVDHIPRNWPVCAAEEKEAGPMTCIRGGRGRQRGEAGAGGDRGL